MPAAAGASPAGHAARGTGFKLAVIGSFAAIYIIWGSTFLAIRWAVETIPPLGMIGVRSLIAGAVLYGGARMAGAAAPSPREWTGAALIGAMFFLGCHGLLAMLQRHVPSGVAAVVMATIPIWAALLSWIAGAGRPSWRLAAGLALGLAGIVVLVAGRGTLGGSLDPVSGLLLLVTAISWAAGTVFAGRVPKPASPFLAAGMQLTAGGALVTAVALIAGEGPALLAAEFSARSLGGLAYLILIGSVLTFGAYIWLLRVVPPAKVATYAFVNPVVAVLLGWSLAGEELTPAVAIATLLVLAALLLIMVKRR